MTQVIGGPRSIDFGRPESDAARGPAAFGVCEDGAAILEFVLVLPILLTLLGGAFELGRVLLVDAALEDGVRGGARYLARVADPYCRPACSIDTAHAIAMARERILENTRLAATSLRVYPVPDTDPGVIVMRAEADVAVDLLGWVGLAPSIHLAATHRESRIAE